MDLTADDVETLLDVGRGVAEAINDIRC